MSKYAVIDLEMCRISAKDRKYDFGYPTELIQIGAVLLDENYDTVDTFMTLVHPEFGTIDQRIEKLTGISNRDVADAPDTKTALTAFFEWLPDDAKIVSWSESDKNQIAAELTGKSIVIPCAERCIDEWIDCQVTFSEKMDNAKQYNLTDALNICSINSVDGEHDALVDAKNTALLFAKMNREENLRLSDYYSEKSEALVNNPMAELLKGFRF